MNNTTMSTKPSTEYSVRSGKIPADSFIYPTGHSRKCECQGLGTVKKEWIENRPYRCDCDAHTLDLSVTNHAATCDALPCPFGEL